VCYAFQAFLENNIREKKAGNVAVSKPTGGGTSMRMVKRAALLVAAFLAIALFSPIAEARDVDDLLRSMTLEEKIGQLLFPAFRTEKGRGVTAITPQVSQALRQYQVGGVILFRENLVTADQTSRLISELKSLTGSKLPLFIGIDQEGGRVTRLPYGTIMPGNMALGATGNPENAFLAARAIGEELAELGFNLNFAPVLDINSSPDNPVIGVRSFGEDPDLVAAMGKAFIRGLDAAGIAMAVKHFPGHGDTSVDSHLGLPVLLYSSKQLERREWKPFQLALSESPDMVMTAHIALPAIEPATVRSARDGSSVFLPATLSQSILTGLLRQRLGYNGIIITDALDMKSISEHFGAGEAAVRAIQAGADILLMPDLEKSYTALVAAVQQAELSEARIDQSVRRILAVKEKRGLFSGVKPTVQPETKKQRAALEARLAGKAVTLLKNDANLLPFVLRPNRRVLLLASKTEQLIAIRQETERIFQTAGLSAESVAVLEYQGAVSPAHQAALTAADQIILVTESADAAGRDPARSPVAATAAALAGLAAQAGKPLVVMAVRNPYDIVYLQAAPAFLAVYAPVVSNMAAGLRVIFGLAEPQGKLPVTIPGKDGKILYPRGFGL
jgi:beta-N-acetylhexosaminidase